MWVYHSTSLKCQRDLKNVYAFRNLKGVYYYIKGPILWILDWKVSMNVKSLSRLMSDLKWDD